MNKREFIETANGYLSRGFSVAPLKVGEKVPSIKWEEYQTRKASQDELKAWGDSFTELNIAIITGSISGITIVDIDGEDGFKSAEALSLPQTLSVTTGKGKHLYYKHCSNPAVNNRACILPGIDIRNNGGYVVAPPSIHPSGKIYRFDDPTASIADFPQCVIDACLKSSASKNKTPQKETTTEGSRNVTLTAMAGRMRQAGADFDSALQAAKRKNSTFVPPLDDAEVETVMRSVYRYDTTQPLHRLTEVGVAERFVERYGDYVCFNSASGNWMIYNGIYWESQATSKTTCLCMSIVDKIISVTRSIPEEVPEDSEYREAYEAFSRQCETNNKIKNIAVLSANKLSKPSSVFDCDPYMLNCNTVTLNLRTLAAQPHCGADMLSKHIPVDYDPAADCPIWKEFLSRIFAGNSELISYIQRAVGYCLTGDTSEQVFFTLYGSGANGKSVFLDTLLRMFGDYAQQATFSTFLAKSGDGGIRNDVACMEGARFISAAESGVFKTIDDALIKDITGGKKVKARFLHKEFFEFEPQMKIWLATNHKPNIHDDSNGMWRRVRLIPFTVTIPKEEQDRQLYFKLIAEAPGILNWCIEGLKQWSKHGLGSCLLVDEATSEYQENMDVLGKFIYERIVVGDGKQVKSSAVYEAFADWCKHNGETVWKHTTFSMKFSDKGFRKVRKSDGVYWFGLDLNLQF